MAEDLALHPETLEKVREIKGADIVAGIPSFNNARTIGHVVQAVTAGMAKYFPRAKAVLVNSDGGSRDGTREEVLRVQTEDLDTILVSHPLYPIHKLVTPYHGIPGKGSAFRTIFKIAVELNARACLVVDSDLRSITPEWVQLLLAPVLERGFDYVAPLYARHKYDGTITNSIVYPMTRALYGLCIRQPIGGDFGFSGALARDFLGRDVWKGEAARFGIDIWMTTVAITGGYKVCQSFLGAKIHDAKDPGTHLSQMLYQVVSSLFGLMEDYQPFWFQVSGSREVPVFGFRHEVGLEPVPVNQGKMVENFQQARKDLYPIWQKALSSSTLEELSSLSAAKAEGFRFPDELWVKVVYDFAGAFHKRVLNREHLIKSMTPLYLGRTASIVNEWATATAEEVEAKIESLCQRFEALKPYLLSIWG